MKRLSLGLRSFVAAVFVAAPSLVTPVHADEYGQPPNTFCARTKLCVDLAESEQLGYYSGHDEPSLLFYSDTAGAGNNNVWQIQLPKDPPVRPKDDGTGGTWNFQLHPAFWFGMAICESESFPNPGVPCTPNSDTNIADNPD